MSDWTPDFSAKISPAAMVRLREIYDSGALDQNTTPREAIIALSRAIAAEEEPTYSVVTTGGYDQIRHLEQMDVQDIMRFSLTTNAIGETLKLLSTLLAHVAMERIEMEVSGPAAAAE